MSAAVASPWLMMKFACLLRHRGIADAVALEARRPRSGAPRDRRGGLVNTEPQLHSPIGCDALRFVEQRAHLGFVARRACCSKREPRAEEPLVRRGRHDVAIARPGTRSPARVLLVPCRSMVSTSMTWRQVSPPNAPAFIASAPPNVPGMPAKNSAGPRPHLMHCLRDARAGDARFAEHARSGCARSSRSSVPCVRDDHAAQPAVAHQQVAAEPDPVDRHVRRAARAGTRRARCGRAD